jgi:hypothetical protein
LVQEEAYAAAGGGTEEISIDFAEERAVNVVKVDGG